MTTPEWPPASSLAAGNRLSPSEVTQGLRLEHGKCLSAITAPREVRLTGPELNRSQQRLTNMSSKQVVITAGGSRDLLPRGHESKTAHFRAHVRNALLSYPHTTAAALGPPPIMSTSAPLTWVHNHILGFLGPSSFRHQVQTKARKCLEVVFMSLWPQIILLSRLCLLRKTSSIFHVCSASGREVVKVSKRRYDFLMWTSALSYGRTWRTRAGDARENESSSRWKALPPQHLRLRRTRQS